MFVTAGKKKGSTQKRRFSTLILKSDPKSVKKGAGKMFVSHFPLSSQMVYEEFQLDISIKNIETIVASKLQCSFMGANSFPGRER